MLLEKMARENIEKVVGAVGIEIASLLSKSIKENGVAPPPYSQRSDASLTVLEILCFTAGVPQRNDKPIYHAVAARRAKMAMFSAPSIRN
jgi:hypothetical protein